MADHGTSGCYYEKRRIAGVALSVSDEETVFYALTHEKEPEGQLSLFAEAVESVDDTAEITEALQELSAGTDTQIATFDVKHQYDYLDRSSTEQYFDVLIAAYLLNPLKNDYDMEAIASEHLGILIPGRAEVFGKRDFRTLLSEDTRESHGVCVLRSLCLPERQKSPEGQAGGSRHEMSHGGDGDASFTGTV